MTLSKYPSCVTEASKRSGISKVRLQESYDRGIGAWKTNPSSVRNLKGVKGGPGRRLPKQQWACARVNKLAKLRKRAGYDQDLLEGSGQGFRSGLWVVRPSRRKTKKWMATHDETDTVVHFGQLGYEDYTMHKDASRRENYLSRHSANQDWNDLSTAGAWARHLLWSKPTVKESARAMEDKFSIKVKVVGR